MYLALRGGRCPSNLVSVSVFVSVIVKAYGDFPTSRLPHTAAVAVVDRDICRMTRHRHTAVVAVADRGVVAD